jgi:hypothetical protein
MKTRRYDGDVRESLIVNVIRDTEGREMIADEMLALRNGK